ncbi:hypothetical protein [Streptomyces smyrnaeus]|uniref:hypothetical protein n=1 Tax=Streptomyces smyrnaeus TaxID=1387713 RepID=UPI0036AA1363
MIFIEVFLAYGAAVDAVVSTSRVWGPVLLGAAALGWGLRRTPRRKRRTPSGQRPDTDPDLPAGTATQGG